MEGKKKEEERESNSCICFFSLSINNLEPLKHLALFVQRGRDFFFPLKCCKEPKLETLKTINMNTGPPDMSAS